MIATDVQRCGRSVLVSATGELAGDVGALERAIDGVSADVRVLMVDDGHDGVNSRLRT
ncbi:hypothetical protein [Streptomyces sp. 147326]|uniref:hypothetical protein n=1 Tax=Streptomyces sp. 147326 TaxID=3074379 RepID=UPI003857DE8F